MTSVTDRDAGSPPLIINATSSGRDVDTPAAREPFRALFNIAEVRKAAEAALPRPVFDFADGAAEDERTLRRNVEAFGDVAFLPRPLNGAAVRDLSVDLFGRRQSLPLVIAPTGLAGLFWPEGEKESARAAAAAGIPYCASHGSVCTLEDIAGTGIEPRWMQVFIYNDKGFTREIIDRAAAARFDVLVLTIDNQVLGNRERDLRNGFTIPPRFGLSGTLQTATKLAWLRRMRTILPRLTFGNYVRPGRQEDIATLAGRMADLLDQGLSWRDVEWVRSIWAGPLVIKGILHPDEAREAVERGADGIIVSNHGGRQLDGAVASFDALPAIVEAVRGRIPVLMDGGIRRGTDIVKAIATGASACLIGRPQLWGLAVGGQAGVQHVLNILRREMDRTMGLIGASTLGELGPHCLVPMPFRGSRG
jgi:isopentenyl diphosphate isomerase/L-lactate dehydrogenase-like FMN-dependent dehydrogenase